MKASELVLAPNGSLYHIHLTGKELADDVILVGDPARVDMFKEIFDTIEFESMNREIHALTGTYKSHRFTAISTGMGTDNIDIVLTELDAAANIDLAKGETMPQHRTLNLIRIGTSGSLQSDIPCGSLVAGKYAVGMDGLMNYYQGSQTLLDTELKEAFMKHMCFDDCFAHPYGARGSETLLQKVAFDMFQGITATAPGFYAPQGRDIRLHPAIENLNDKLAAFAYKDTRLTNLEMETSAIYGFSQLMGHNALTICLIIANRPNGDFLNDYHPQMHTTIEKILNRLAR